MPKNCKKDTRLWVKYRANLDAMWEKDMADYCEKQTAELVELSDGTIVPIEKRKICKSFPVGYSDCGWGQTYEEACREAQYARTNDAYFLRKNMDEFSRVLGNLGDHGRNVMVTLCGNGGNKHMVIKRTTDILEAVGGSAFIPALMGKTVGKLYVCTREDVQRIRDGYERAAAAHMKNCKAYLKRYGLSNLRVWTYWIDD